jgi:hypothetical protein
VAKRREPTLRDEIAASGETPAAQRAALDDDFDYLAREFLTWLVFHADTDGGAFAGKGDVPDFAIQFGGRLVLKTHAGLITDLTVKGASPGLSPDLRYALAGGLAVSEAELRLVIGDAESSDDAERAYTFALAAEHFDLKRVKLPALLTEEEDDRVDERLALLAELDAALEHAFGHFLALRGRPTWDRTVVPALRTWLTEGT